MLVRWSCAYAGSKFSAHFLMASTMHLDGVCPFSFPLCQIVDFANQTGIPISLDFVPLVGSWIRPGVGVPLS